MLCYTHMLYYICDIHYIFDMYYTLLQILHLLHLLCRLHLLHPLDLLHARGSYTFTSFATCGSATPITSGYTQVSAISYHVQKALLYPLHLSHLLHARGSDIFIISTMSAISTIFATHQMPPKWSAASVTPTTSSLSTTCKRI